MRFGGNWSDWTLREIAEFEPASQKKEDEKKSMERAYDEGDIWKRGREKRIKANIDAVG